MGIYPVKKLGKREAGKVFAVVLVAVEVKDGLASLGQGPTLRMKARVEFKDNMEDILKQRGQTSEVSKSKFKSAIMYMKGGDGTKS